MTPAELTRVSKPPKCVWQAATVCWTDVGEVTSSTRGSTRSLYNSSAVARNFSLSISAMATWAPWASRVLAVPRPKPLAPPVISARLGFKVIFLASQRKPAPLFGQRDLGVVGVGTVEEQRVAQDLH